MRLTANGQACLHSVRVGIAIELEYQELEHPGVHLIIGLHCCCHFFPFASRISLFSGSIFILFGL